MRLLLDTHALLWWLEGHDALSKAAQAAIAETGNEVFVSAASVWEIATKVRLGKLPMDSTTLADFEAVLASQEFRSLSVTLRHGLTAGTLPGPHRDPFDRMLIAQAMIEDLVLVSNEAPFDAYGVRRLW